jgi:hypothetical protein
VTGEGIITQVLPVVGPLVTMTAGVVLWVMKLVGTEREARERGIADECAKREKLAKEFSDYREKVAREFVTRDTLERMEERVLKSIDRIGDRLDRVLSVSVAIDK